MTATISTPTDIDIADTRSLRAALALAPTPLAIAAALVDG